MNDFTKEELDYIYDSIYHNELEHNLEENIPDFAVNLLTKIESMIDNYCEHEHVIECADCEIIRCGHCKKASRK